MAARIRRYTAREWYKDNPILGVGERGEETNTGRVKYGDNETRWNDLPYETELAGPAGPAGSPGPVGPAGPVGPVGPAGPASPRSWQFSQAGVLAVKTGTHRIYNDFGFTITLATVRASVGTAPTGSALTAVLAKGGTALATVSVAADTNTGTVAGPFTWENGTYLTVNITAIGSTVAGSDLTLTATEA